MLLFKMGSLSVMIASQGFFRDFPRNRRISQTNSQFTYKNQCRDVLKAGVLLMQDVLVGSKLIDTTMPESTFYA